MRTRARLLGVGIARGSFISRTSTRSGPFVLIAPRRRDKEPLHLLGNARVRDGR